MPASQKKKRRRSLSWRGVNSATDNLASAKKNFTKAKSKLSSAQTRYKKMTTRLRAEQRASR